jgi:hypothetical protein
MPFWGVPISISLAFVTWIVFAGGLATGSVVAFVASFLPLPVTAGFYVYFLRKCTKGTREAERVVPSSFPYVHIIIALLALVALVGATAAGAVVGGGPSVAQAVGAFFGLFASVAVIFTNYDITKKFTEREKKADVVLSPAWLPYVPYAIAGIAGLIFVFAAAVSSYGGLSISIFLIAVSVIMRMIVSYLYKIELRQLGRRPNPIWISFMLYFVAVGAIISLALMPALAGSLSALWAFEAALFFVYGGLPALVIYDSLVLNEWMKKQTRRT